MVVLVYTPTKKCHFSDIEMSSVISGFLQHFLGKLSNSNHSRQLRILSSPAGLFEGRGEARVGCCWLRGSHDCLRPLDFTSSCCNSPGRLLQQPEAEAQMFISVFKSHLPQSSSDPPPPFSGINLKGRMGEEDRAEKPRRCLHQSITFVFSLSLPRTFISLQRQGKLDLQVFVCAFFESCKPGIRCFCFPVFIVATLP